MLEMLKNLLSLVVWFRQTLGRAAGQRRDAEDPIILKGEEYNQFQAGLLDAEQQLRAGIKSKQKR